MLVSETSPTCTRCGLFQRMPALVVCGSCFEVVTQAMWDSLRDEDAPLPKCGTCGRTETPDAEAAISRGEAPVSLALVAGDQRWTCQDCLNGDTPETWGGN